MDNGTVPKLYLKTKIRNDLCFKNMILYVFVLYVYFLYMYYYINDMISNICLLRPINL